MAKNYFNRYVWLIDTIHRNGHISFQDISRQWERSAINDDGAPLAERTFHNHRKAIEESFGIEILCDRTLGYYIANPDELDGEGMREWLLESISLNNVLSEAGSIRERILFGDGEFLCGSSVLSEAFPSTLVSIGLQRAFHRASHLRIGPHSPCKADE